MMVETANGAIEVDDLGATLMHEHLVIAFEGWASDGNAQPPVREELVARCVDRIEELKAEGFSSILDPCPIDLGRDAELYAEVGARTGFNILFATGLYHEHFAAPYWRFKLAAESAGADYVAAMYIRELTEGIGPSRLKPAVIKLAVGLDSNSTFERELLKATAIASNETGAPILTHTEAIGGDVMLERLVALGVPAHRVIVGHSCGSPDHAYHGRIVGAGAYIGFDRFGMTAIQSDEVRTGGLLALLEAGHAQSVIVSHDCVFCQKGQMLAPAKLTRDPRHFTRDIAPVLRQRGVPQSTLDSIFRDNPRRYFRGEAPAQELGTAAERDVFGTS
jgi:phosphotriesterase-related protein